MSIKKAVAVGLAGFSIALIGRSMMRFFNGSAEPRNYIILAIGIVGLISAIMVNRNCRKK